MSGAGGFVGGGNPGGNPYGAYGYMNAMGGFDPVQSEQPPPR